jgi:hypothetical protein
MRMAVGIAVSALFALAVGGALPAAALTPLDAPTLDVGVASRVTVEVRVTAGASGAPAGFAIEWMRRSDFDTFGGWPASPAQEPTLVRSQFFGTPTLNPSTGSYLLAPRQYVEVELGDLFDETGVLSTQTGELPIAEDIVLRARAVGTTDRAPSAYTPTAIAGTMSEPLANCTYTLGYWKTHAAAWPVNWLTLGTVTYSQTQLMSILNKPAAGNGLLILAHQLIAAQLNVAAGADPTPVAAAIAAADALIGGLVVPPVGGGYLDPASVTSVKETLDGYNNGLLGVPHCGQVPTVNRTWGGMKAIYR